MGLAASLDTAATALLTDLSLCNSDLGYNDLKFWPLCSEIATIETFGGHYTQWSVVFIGFSDHLVVTYTMQNSILFSDLNPFDGG